MLKIAWNVLRKVSVFLAAHPNHRLANLLIYLTALSAKMTWCILGRVRIINDETCQYN